MSGENTHEKLRRVAAELFARRGYGGASMAEIAEQVGVRKASLYNYYASKEELVLDLLERSLKAWEEACRPAIAVEGNLERRLAAVLEAAVDFTENNPQSVAIIRLAATQLGGDLGKKARAQLSRHERSWLGAMTQLFADAVGRGEVKEADPLDLALFWNAFVDGILINQLLATAKAKDYRAHLQQLWQFFWRGVAGTRPTTEVGG